MALSFAEKMQGHLVDAAGRLVPVDFEIRAEAPSAGALLGTCALRLSGIVHAPPLADRAALDGTLRLKPLGRPTMAYDLRFAGDDGAPLRLTGFKVVTLREPLATSSRMTAELRRHDEVVATGELHFDLNAALALLASFSPRTSWRQVPLQAPAPADVALPPVLPAAERKLLEALVEAALVPGERVPAGDAETVARTEQILAGAGPQVLAAWRAGLRALDATCRLRTGSSVVALPLTRRREWVASLARGDAPVVGAVLQRLLDLVALPVRSAHFSRSDYLRAVGFPDPTPRAPEAPPRWLRQVHAAEELQAETTVHADVVVVGTGAGGAALAANLAERGLAVALVEEGRLHRRHEHTGTLAERKDRLFRDRGMLFSVGVPPVALPLGRTVGGTTVINSGTCFRLPPHVLHRWRAELGFPTDFDPASFDRYYDQVAAELRVAPNELQHLGAIAGVVARGAEAMGLPHAPLPRNAPGCDGQGECLFGCPTAAKRSTDVSYVPRALRAGAELYTGLPVRRLLLRGGRAVAVEARGPDRLGQEKVLRVRARAVVLACGSLLSPLLLQDQGLRMPWLGRNLSLHPSMGLFSLYDGPMRPWRGVSQGYGVHGFEGEGLVFEGVYLPPEIAALAMPPAGPELTRWMDAHDRSAQFGFMIVDDSVGSVRRGADGRPVVRYPLSERSRARLQKGTAVLTELLLRGGAREVWTGLGSVPAISTVAAARRLQEARVPALDFHLLGPHPLGTTRMGTDPARAVVDFEHRVFGTENLYVVDGGVVPSALGVNPQMTIMAFATRAAEILAARLGA